MAQADGGKAHSLMTFLAWWCTFTERWNFILRRHA